MRHILRLGLVAGLFLADLPPDAFASDYHLRFRANDAPLAGRFTVDAYMLDTLDAVVSIPGPGRVVLVRMGDPGGQAFLIPGDFAFQNRHKERWQAGFQPLGNERQAGLMAKDEEFWALWWVPSDTTFGWEDPLELRLWYGESRGDFLPLEPPDREQALKRFPWDLLATGIPNPGRTAADLDSLPNPAVFDLAPVPRTRTNPSFPKLAKVYAYEGVVAVSAVVSDKGKVVDAYVVQSTAQHVLNVSALVCVMEWEFIAGRKNGKPVAGEMLIPITFTRGSRD